MLRLICAIAFMVLSATSAGARTVEDCPTVPLSPEADFRLDLAPFACAFVDDTGNLTLEDVAGGASSSRFKPVEGALVDFGFGARQSRYWVRLKIENPGEAGGQWWLTHDIPVAQSIDVYLVPDGAAEAGATRLLSLTASDTFDARPIAYRHLMSEVALDAGDAMTLFIGYRTNQATEMPLFVEAGPNFLKRVQNEAGQILALTALIFGMGLISTVYLYGLDGRRAFAYGGYMLSSVVLLVHMEGYAFQFLWPNAPGFNHVALAILSMVSVALGINFVARFAAARDRARGLYWVAMTTIGLLACLTLLSVPLISTIAYKNITLLTVGFGTMLQVALASAAARQKTPGAVFLVVGFGALAASFLFGIFGYLTEGLFAQELVGAALRVGFLVEAIAFSTAIALRIMAARRERDGFLREQLRLTEDRLHLSEALRRAEDDRQRAAAAAQRSKDALASAAHDIRQPLASLQMALTGGDLERQDMKDSLNYLDEIVRAGLEAPTEPLGTGDTDPPQIGAQETFNLNLVFQNVAAMFKAEADRQGTDLRVVHSSESIFADPLSVMRSVGNLVSNALQHAGASRILLGCRRRGPVISIEVHDDGQGMDASDCVRLRERGAKGAQSTGSGLGLAIVGELAEQDGIGFDLASTLNVGTVARLDFARGPSAPSLHEPGQEPAI